MTRSAPALAVLATVAVAIALAASEGGFPAGSWYPAALFALTLLAVVAAAAGWPRDAPRAAIGAVALFAAYAAWSYASIAWAEQPGDAVDGAGRALLYALVLALAALWAHGRRTAAAAIALLGLGIGGVGAVELVRVAATEDPEGYFVFARLAEPVGYPNANAALWSIGMLACLVVAARPAQAVPLRAAALGSAGLLASLALMAQSRAWAAALPVVAIVLLALSPDRGRLALAAAAVAGALVAIGGPVLDVTDALGPTGDLDELTDRAAVAIAIAAAALAALGGATALAERLRPPPERVVQGAGVALIAACALAATGAAVGVAATQGGPVEVVRDVWREVKTEGSPAPEPGSRLSGSLGSDRYDFWRVAWLMFRERPVAGHGAEAFQQAYLLHGRGSEIPRYPHSLPLRVLAGTGAIGALLLASALALLAAGGWRATRRGDPAGRAYAAGGLALLAYWLVHGAVDWLWEFPALGVAALLGGGLACALGPRRGAGVEGAGAAGAVEGAGAGAAEDAEGGSAAGEAESQGAGAAAAADETERASADAEDGAPPPGDRAGLAAAPALAGARVAMEMHRARTRGAAAASAGGEAPRVRTPLRRARARAGAALRARQDDTTGAPSGPRRRRAAIVAAAGLALAVPLGAPWLAQRYVDRAEEGWREDPAGALRDLGRAEDLNPFASRPALTAAAIAAALGDGRTAEAALRRALERDSDSHFATLALGALLAESGRTGEAERLLARATRIAPRDPVAALALRRLRAGRKVSLAEINVALAQRASSRLR